MHRLIKSECPATPDPAVYMLGPLPLYGVGLNFDEKAHDTLDVILTPALTVFSEILEEIELLGVFLYDRHRNRRKLRTDSLGIESGALGVCGIGFAADLMERENRAEFVPWLFMVELARLVSHSDYNTPEHKEALGDLVELYDTEIHSNLAERYLKL